MDAARSIEKLIFTYAERIDGGDLDGVAELFAHGRVVPSPDVAEDDHLVGRAAVRELYSGMVKLHAGVPRTKHVTTNVVVDVAEGASVARARSYYTVFQQTDELPLQPIIAGRYDDTFHVVDGIWQFETRTIFVDLVGDLTHHLTMEL